MKIGKLKKLGVLALVLVPLTLSGCKKGEDVNNGEVVEDNIQEEVVEDTSTTEDTTTNTVVEEVITPITPIVNTVKESKDAELHFIPVGLGESVLYRDGSDYMLIDSGGIKGATVNYLKSKGVTKLKYFVLTQWDFDNIEDAKAIIDTFQVDYIVARGIESTAHASAKALHKAMIDKGLVISEVNDNKVEYKIGNSTFTLLNRVAKNSVEDDNALSVHIDIDGTEVLISSDASTNQEEIKQLGDVDIYSVARHGDSRINTSERIDVLKPKYSVIPTDGKTIDYTATANLLESIGSKVYKTIDGVVVYTITDEGIKVNR